MKILILLLSLLTLTTTSCSKRTECYRADPKDIKVEWTAFKTTQKVPVKGNFNTATVSGPTGADTLANLMKGFKIFIDSTSVNTGNPGRDATLKEFFFEKITPSPKIEASVTDVQGDTQGTMNIQINIAGSNHTLPFQFETTPDGNFQAKASFDMLNFGLKAAYDSIHQTCETLHQGEDKVSKTWTTVDLSLTGKFQKTCP